MLPHQLFRSITNFLSQNVIVVIDLAEVVLYFVFSDNLIVKNKWKNLIIFTKLFFEKDGFKVNYHFLSISMRRKKDLVRTVHNRREPQRHLLEKNGTVKFAMKSCKFLRNFRWNIPEKFSGISGGKIPEKFSGISWDYVFYAELGEIPHFCFLGVSYKKMETRLGLGISI